LDGSYDLMEHFKGNSMATKIEEEQVPSSFRKFCMTMEEHFWKTRFIALSAVISSLAISAFWFLYIFVDLFHLGGYVIGNIGNHGFRDQAVFYTIETIDSMLMALIFMVFSFGIYELFVSKIDKGVADDDEKIRGKILDIPNLASLEAKLAKLIIMILIVKVFYYGLSVELHTEGKESLTDLLKLAGVVSIIALSLFLSHSKVGPKD